MPIAPRTFRVWILVTPRSQMLDAIGPFEVLRYATQVSVTDGYDLRLVSVSGGRMQFNSGIEISMHHSLAEAAEEGLPHTIVVGGGGTDIEPGSDEAVFAHWLRQHAPNIPRITSVCSGAFTLGAAGLLDGRPATTHWQLTDKLAAKYPTAEVENERIFTQSDSLWTAAGMTAGIDMALEFVGRDLGRDVSLAVAHLMVLYLRRPGGQRQFSRHLQLEFDSGSLPQRARDVVLQRMSAALDVNELASALGMSSRTLSRRLSSETGLSPGRFVRTVKLAEGRRLLEQTELAISEIADHIGVGGESTFRRLFRSTYGTAPTQYRAQFSILPD